MVTVNGAAATLPGAAATVVTVTVVGTNLSATVDSSGYFQLSGVPSGTVRLQFTDGVVSATLEVSNVGEESLIELQVQISGASAVIVNQVELLERDIDSLAGERDCSVEAERLFAVRREISRVAEILDRLAQIAESDQVETIQYVGPTRMIDLRRRSPVREKDPRLAGVRVLVVDDDPGICRSLAELLEAEG